MRIQWSSTAAQETAERLNRAEYGLEDCLRQTALVYSALAEVNPDGENKVLQRLTEQFGACVQRLKRLRDSVNGLNGAVRRTDERFQEAESRILHLCDAMEQGNEAPVYTAPAAYIDWAPEAFSVMPNMRINAAPLPFWLRDILNETDQFIN